MYTAGSGNSRYEGLFVQLCVVYSISSTYSSDFWIDNKMIKKLVILARNGKRKSGIRI